VEDTNIDLQSLFRNKIDNMLITTSWVDKVKELIGLQAVSPIWGDRPAWYFWMSQTSGAYQLELNETVNEQWENDHLARGMFGVKCYPYTNTEKFDGFSFEEQEFIKSNFFDDTHTPRFEQKDRIPESLFNVAAIEMITGSTDNWTLFSLEGLNSMQIHYGRKIYQTYPELNKDKQYIAGEKARDVPGYDLGYQLFSRLLSLYSFYSKIKPVRVLLSRSPGFKYVCNSSQEYQCVDTEDINIYSLNVLFSDNSEMHTTHGKKLIEQRLKESGNKIIFDQKFTSGHLPSNHISPIVNTDLDEKWWSLADADYKSHMASTCGCEDCHH
jgi:hypothetical protein